MNLIVICVFYPPIRTSASIQINYLVEESIKHGNIVTVITPDSNIKSSFEIIKENNLSIYRFKSNKLQDINFLKRTINEFLMPFKIIQTIIFNGLEFKNYEGIIWWSPSIFLTPLIIFLKFRNKCPDYLILRDIFPRWAKDLNLISNNLIYNLFDIFFKLQCYVTDYIGIQSKGNRKFIPKNILGKKIKVEVLNNWYKCTKKSSKFVFDNKKFFRKKVFIYSGNIGLAQGLETLIYLLEELKDNKEILFLFIGRGTNFLLLNNLVKKRKINNVIFHKEISNYDLESLYEECFAGLVLLDKRHETHNIPGKFISYLHSGLPVFALVNKGNDLIEIINKNKIGYATSNHNKKNLKIKIEKFILEIVKDKKIRERAKLLAKKEFNVSKVYKQIIKKF